MAAALPDRAKRWPLGWGAGAVVLLLVAALCAGSGRPPTGHAVPAQTIAGPQSTSATPADAPPASALARSRPVDLRIPAIGLSVPVISLGLNADGTVQVPANFQEPGWFELGPSPGQVGSAVILGHVDSYRGPAVFFRLRSLRAGDNVDVTLASGVIAHFVVTGVAMYPKDQFPARQVYGSHGYSALQLVTCGGTFDTRTRSYRSNLVVYTSLTATTAGSHARNVPIGVDRP